MSFSRGDRVVVRGFRGVEACLRVWESKGGRGLLLCSEQGYQRLKQGKEAPLVGFPMSDIVQKVAD